MTELRVRERFSDYKLLQFSDDPIVARGWFKSTELSTYDGENSLDVQAIARPDRSYDVIVCSHVIEHVPDPRAAVRELTRILSDDGLMFLAYPAPSGREKTSDWGYPDWSQHGHYRIFGRDFEAEYRHLVPNAWVIAVTGTDEATGDLDRVYIVTKSTFWRDRVLALCMQTNLISGPTLAAIS